MLASPGLTVFIRLNTGAFFQGGLILEVKKMLQNQAIAVLMKIRFTFYWFLMGTLHEMVTWDKKHFGEWKRKQWCKKNKEIRSIKKLISFQAPPALGTLQQGVFVPCDCFVQRAH